MSWIDRLRPALAIGVLASGCSYAKPVLESAEFGCEGKTPVLRTTITNADKDRAGDDLALTITDPRGIWTVRHIPLTIGTVNINVEKLDANPQPESFQPAESYRVRLAALRGISQAIDRTYADRTLTLRANLCKDNLISVDKLIV